MTGASSPHPTARTEAFPLQAQADFRHVRDWVFDLDNTLYRADCGVFAQIEGRMTDYVMRFMDLPREEARALQKRLYREYGTTLNGLMQCHGARPDDYLAYVHDIDLSALAPEPRMQDGLSRLPGRRFIFTNGCRHHAARILDRLGLTSLFEDIWDIRTLAFRPKPDPAAYAQVIARSRIDPKSAAMFDDIVHNLAEARVLGMTTVWLNTGAPWGKDGPQGQDDSTSFVSHETGDLPHFLHSIRI